MRKNGFTLIELLSVITIIALISVIAVPNILRGISSKKNDISATNLKLLQTAANLYVDKYPNYYTSSVDADGSTYCIVLQDLVRTGLLSTPFKDVNGTEVDYSKFIKLTYDFEHNTFVVDNNLLEGSNCTEVINYVNAPILSDGMIPIVFDSGVKKADVGSKWYSYSNKNWANAVLVKSDKVSLYKDAVPGTTIDDADIVGYFVWIPRFKYQLFDSASRSEINVAFSSVSDKVSGSSTGQWLTHPAFSYNGKELAGIWVGKYNSSNSDGNIIIKSGDAWTGIDYNRANELVNSMTNFNNIYGLSGVNTHMVRNSEWGAVTYLANSKYGINDDMDSSSTTTGNNTGIYNMVGNKEYVILDSSSVNDLGYSLIETNSWTDNSNTYKDGNNLYVTRGGSSIFNYDKSTINSSDTTFRVSLINKDTSTEYKPKYIVTFDPNGGSVDVTSKEVTYGDPYGELPTPTREGYTFKGWNGRNYYNYQDTNVVSGGVSTDSEGFITINTSNNIEYYKFYTNNLNVLPNSTYIAFLEINEVSNVTGLLFITSGNGAAGQDITQFNGNQVLGLTDNTIQKKYLTTRTTFDNVGNYGLRTFYHNKNRNINEILIFRISVLDVDDTITEDNFKYEPYYIESDTTVVQDKNHTLKAIWEENE